MSSVVIVTDQCYLLADAVNYIVINELDEHSDGREYLMEPPEQRKKPSKKKKSKTQAQHNSDLRIFIQEIKPFAIVVNFIPKGNPPNPNSPHLSKHASGDSSTVQVKVLGLRRALKVYKDIVAQIREQIPDEKFLDTLVDRYLAAAEEDPIDKMEFR